MCEKCKVRYISQQLLCSQKQNKQTKTKNQTKKTQNPNQNQTSQRHMTIVIFFLRIFLLSEASMFLQLGVGCELEDWPTTCHLWPRWSSLCGNNRGAKGRFHCKSIFQISTSIRFANIPLANVRQGLIIKGLIIFWGRKFYL